MSVALLERNGQEVIVKNVDVRPGGSVEDVADQVKAREIGRLLLEWWQNGSSHWAVRFHFGPMRQVSHHLDLRRELLKALRSGFRISQACQYLAVHEDGASMSHPQASENVEAIGRDLLSWWADGWGGSHTVAVPGKGGKPITYDIRVGLNQAMQDYLSRKKRAERDPQAA